MRTWDPFEMYFFKDFVKHMKHCFSDFYKFCKGLISPSKCKESYLVSCIIYMQYCKS